MDRRYLIGTLAGLVLAIACGVVAQVSPGGAISGIQSLQRSRSPLEAVEYARLKRLADLRRASAAIR